MVKSIHHWESHCRLLTLPPPLLETNSSVPRVSLALMASPPALPHCPGTHLLKQEPLLGGDPMLLPSQHLSRSVLLGRARHSFLCSHNCPRMSCVRPAWVPVLCPLDNSYSQNVTVPCSMPCAPSFQKTSVDRKLLERPCLQEAFSLLRDEVKELAQREQGGSADRH